MSPWEILGWLFVAVIIAGLILFVVMLPIIWRTRREFWQDHDELEDWHDRNRPDDAVRDHYRDSGALYGWKPQASDEPRVGRPPAKPTR